MNEINFDRLMSEWLRGKEKQRLLLHSCCAPCSSHCLSELNGKIRVTVLYYNPNLDCEAEYEKRKAEQIRFLKETSLADFLDCDYAKDDFTAASSGLEREKEGGARCAKCFELRLRKTAQVAKANGFDCFATTLTVSPLKNAKLINGIGKKIAEEEGIEYLPSDFKKRGGYLHSIELSKKYGLYRQNYCGCSYSKVQRDETSEKR